MVSFDTLPDNWFGYFPVASVAIYPNLVKVVTPPDKRGLLHCVTYVVLRGCLNSAHSLIVTRLVTEK